VMTLAGQKFDVYMNDTALVGLSPQDLQMLGKQVDEQTVVDTVGWASLLVFEFLVVQALVNLSDWRKKQQQGSPRSRGRRSSGGMRKKYSRVDEEIGGGSPGSRGSRRGQRPGSGGGGRRGSPSPTGRY
jgi:hypothetical protein